MDEYIKSDVFRYYGEYNIKTFIKGYCENSTIRFLVAFRLSKTKGLKRLLGRVLWKLSKVKKNIQLHYITEVGYGLYIGHGGPIVVNPTAKIGNNCNLSQFTTIGSNHEHAAIIGDNVYIGPNVCIVENVIIGNNVTIGAGSVVTKDIPENATVAGNYAKVLNYDNPGRYIQDKWKV